MSQCFDVFDSTDRQQVYQLLVGGKPGTYCIRFVYCLCNTISSVVLLVYRNLLLWTDHLKYMHYDLKSMHIIILTVCT